MKKVFKGNHKAFEKFSIPAVNVAAPFVGMAVGAETKNRKVAQATKDTSKSISGSSILGSTDMHGNKLLLSVI